MMHRSDETGDRDIRELPHPEDGIRDAQAPGSLSRIGPYQLGRVLGRGCTSIIHEAEHIEQGRKVALKLLDERALGEGPVSRQDALFAREAIILAQLPRYPGILGVLDAGISGGLPYIVTDFVDGQPFDEWMRLRRSDLRGMVRILRDVALSVHHAHENGILHRNLKPSNILVDSSGRGFVTDFGSAKHIDKDQSQSSYLFRGGAVGTPSYMSPEQAACLKSIDRRTDVYSLGAILYEILAGRPPFAGGRTLADLVNVIRGAVVPPSQASPDWATSGADRSIEKICVEALAKSPEGRPATAQAFANELSAWLGELPTGPAPRRRSWFWGLSILVHGALGTLAAAFVQARGQQTS